ncbi:hypothetical protein ACFLV6_03405, partial [Chloroflexota bacterium]
LKVVATPEGVDIKGYLDPSVMKEESKLPINGQSSQCSFSGSRLTARVSEKGGINAPLLFIVSRGFITPVIATNWTKMATQSYPTNRTPETPIAE